MILDLAATARGTFSVKETATHLIELALSEGHLHIVTVPKTGPFAYDRSWCYEDPFVALAAVAMWDGQQDTEPIGYWRRAT